MVMGELSKNGESLPLRRREELSPVKGDRVQLQQVMLNSFLTPFEAMTSADVPERKLKITTDSASQMGAVAVADSDRASTNHQNIFEL